MKQGFLAVYDLLKGQPAELVEAVIAAVSDLCSTYEKVGFFGGVQTGVYLRKELII